MPDKKKPEDPKGTIKFAKKPPFFSTYGSLKKAREEADKDVPKECFYCKEKFEETDGISLALVVGMPNQIIHDHCCEILNQVH